MGLHLLVSIILIMNCVVWNIRGIGKGEKTLSLRNLVKKNKINLLGLIETKHRQSMKNRIRRIWSSDDFEFCESFASETHGGGLVAIWDPLHLDIANKHIGERWIILEGHLKKTNMECCVGIIYGPNNRRLRIQFFEDLKNLLQLINKPTLIMGDFNVVRLACERVGPYRCALSSRVFDNWIQSLGLIELPLHGLRFTWRRNKSKSKLDRGMCCDVWLRSFPNMKLIGLKRSGSDHNPLLLMCEEENN